MYSDSSGYNAYPLYMKDENNNKYQFEGHNPDVVFEFSLKPQRDRVYLKSWEAPLKSDRSTLVDNTFSINCNYHGDDDVWLKYKTETYTLVGTDIRKTLWIGIRYEDWLLDQPFINAFGTKTMSLSDTIQKLLIDEDGNQMTANFSNSINNLGKPGPIMPTEQSTPRTIITELAEKFGFYWFIDLSGIYTFFTINDTPLSNPPKIDPGACVKTKMGWVLHSQLSPLDMGSIIKYPNVPEMNVPMIVACVSLDSYKNSGMDVTMYLLEVDTSKTPPTFNNDNIKTINVSTSRPYSDTINNNRYNSFLSDTQSLEADVINGKFPVSDKKTKVFKTTPWMAIDGSCGILFPEKDAEGSVIERLTLASQVNSMKSYQCSDACSVDSMNESSPIKENLGNGQNFVLYLPGGAKLVYNKSEETWTLEGMHIKLGDNAVSEVARKTDLDNLVQQINTHIHNVTSVGAPTAPPTTPATTPACSSKVKAE